MSAVSSSAIDPAKLGLLRWRCRRGLLENDLLIERFFRSHGETLTPEQADAMLDLMMLTDNDLLDLFLGRRVLSDVDSALDNPAVQEVLNLLKGKP